MLTRRLAGVLTACWLLTVPGGAAASELPTELPPDSPIERSVERDALVAFQTDPAANAGPFLKIDAHALATVPTVMLLAAADARLRTGQPRTATRFFREVIARDSGPPWNEFAELGLGWIDLGRGNYDAADRHYRAVRRGPDLVLIAEVMRGWLAALRGRHAEAIAVLDALAAAPEASINVGQVATLGAGYARYWSREYAAARVTFQRLATSWPSGELADDARYAAAWSLLRTGDQNGAATELRQLALAATPAADVAFSRAAIDLTPAAVIRTGRQETQRISGFVAPDRRMVATFDGDGDALARAALTTLRLEAPLPDADLRHVAEGEGPSVARPRSEGIVEAHTERRSSSASDPHSPERARARWPLAALVLVAVALLGRRRRTRRS